MHLLKASNARLDVYLINLDRAETRRDAMLSKLAEAGLSAQRIAAIDGKLLSFPTPDFCALSYGALHGRRTCPPEVGCYLSHVECAKTFLKGDADFALILEDDVIFADDFLQTIDDAICHAQDWDILRLTTVNRGRKFPFKTISPDRQLAIALTREKGAGAYIINRKAADWIANRLLPMRLAYDIAYDLEFFTGLMAAFVYPICATQDAYLEHESQIQIDIRNYRLPRWRYLTVLPYRAFLETSRFICRSALLGFYKVKYGLLSPGSDREAKAQAQVSEGELSDTTPGSRLV